MSRALSWCLLLVWCAWLFALQGLAASSPRWADMTPDIGIVLLLALDRRLERADALRAVLIVSAARIAFTSDVPLAILVGYAALVFVAHRMRRVAEIDRVIPRVLFAGVGAAALTAYWSFTRSIDLSSGTRVALGIGESLDLSRVWFSAVATGIAAGVVGPLVVRLPGISPLRGRTRSSKSSPFASRA